MAAYGDSNTVLASVSGGIGPSSAIFAGGGVAQGKRFAAEQLGESGGAGNPQNSDFFTEANETKRFGFRALLAWHYLILFSPVLAKGSLASLNGLLVDRQLLLYSVLALTFLFLFLFTKTVGESKTALFNPVVIVTLTVFAAVATLISGWSAFSWPLLYLSATVVLGICEASLMFAWLMFFATLAKKQIYRTLGLDVVLGGAIALLATSLISPADIVVTACLPLVSMASFISLRKKYNFWQAREADRLALEVEDRLSDASALQGEGKNNDLSTYMMRRNISAAIFALAFGIIQGGFLANGTAFLIADNPAPLLGIVLAGVIIFNTKEHFCTHSDAESMYRVALIFLMAGILIPTILGALHGGYTDSAAIWAMIVSGIIALSGFNLFDFGNMMLCLGVVKTNNGGNEHLIVVGRLVVYAAMAFGFALGSVLVTYVMPLNAVEILIICCCIAMLLLLITFSFPASTKLGYESMILRVGANSLSADELSNELAAQCESCGSAGDCSFRSSMLEQDSIREIERAAVETAKQIIATDEAKRQGAQEAVEVEEKKREAIGENVSQEAQKAAQIDEKGSSMKSNARKPAFWRDACDEIAKRYRLSKRETEIFHIISKGRNAEYVSNELFISVHTAKTHIANIYQKLDVHSSQEMLDLIDDFRKSSEEEHRKEAL